MSERSKIEVGYLVKIKPEHTDEDWVDEFFIVLESLLEATVLISNEKGTWKVNTEHLEVINEC